MSANRRTDPEPDAAGQSRSPILGRFVAGTLVALVIMVAVGVLGIWRHARREQAWRERVTPGESFVTPTNR